MLVLMARVPGLVAGAWAAVMCACGGEAVGPEWGSPPSLFAAEDARLTLTQQFLYHLHLNNTPYPPTSTPPARRCSA